MVFCLFVTDPQNFKWVYGIPSATNIRQIGNVLGILALAPIAILFTERDQTKSALALLLVTALLIFIMWSGTRGALLGCAVAVCAAILRDWNVISLGRLGLLALSCIAALAISVSIPAPSAEFGIIRIAESFGTEDSSSGRWKMWQDAVEAIQVAPLFGYGAGTYRMNMLILNGQPFNHPHNFVFQFVYDWGMIGGGIALALLAWFTVFLFRSGVGSARERFLSFGGLVCLVTIASIEGTLFHPLPMIIAIAFMAPHLARHNI